MAKNTMRAGETVRIYCTECLREFDLTFEPKAKGDPSGTEGVEPIAPQYCPGCGEDGLEVTY